MSIQLRTGQRIAADRAVRWRRQPRIRFAPVPCLLMAVSLVMPLLSPVLTAAEVRDLYAAEVQMPADGRLAGAFAAALQSVLVKVTGQPAAGTDAARASLFPDPGRLVIQYSTQPDDRIRVEFDGAAVRRALDAAGQPVWGVQRPLLTLWYGVDAGAGQRYILAGEGAPLMMRGAAGADELRTALLGAARERGLPMVLPLLDAEDLAQVSFADLWGDFRQPLLTASARYGAEGVLIGRARSESPDDNRVRWTLSVGGEQASWEGRVADGPHRAAEFLAQRLATYAGAAGALRVMVTQVGTLSSYGQLRNYFRSLGIVESISVARVNGDTVEFELIVRGDSTRFSRAVEAGSRLARDSLPAGGALQAGRSPDLVYRWVGGS